MRGEAHPGGRAFDLPRCRGTVSKLEQIKAHRGAILSERASAA